MNNRFEEINNFLVYFSQLYYSNPNLEITNKTFYHELAHYNLPEKYKNELDVSDYYSHWINRFSGHDNLKVYYSPRQPGFLQFWNLRGERQNRNDTKCVKLYLSFSKEKIYNCVNKVFDFIDKNGFKTLSKVSNVVRADGVILRMCNEEEARKVIDFVNSDPEIVQSANLTNPFLVRDGVVGVAYDDMLSFNHVVTVLLESYFKKHRSENTLGMVSVADFYNYVYQDYMNKFKNVDAIQSFSKNNISSDEVRRCGGNAEALLNYEQVYKTIIMSLKSNTNSNDIINAISSYKNEENSKSMVSYYDSALSMSTYKVSNDDLTYVKQIVDSYTLHAIKKYGIDKVHLYLSDYMRGNIDAITRDDNYRSLFANNVSRECLQRIIGSDMQQYINQVNNLNQQYIQNLNNLDSRKINLNVAKNILDGYILLTIQKYGVGNVHLYLSDYIRGNIDAITRDDNYREMFVNYVPANIIPMLTEYNLESYIQQVATQYSEQDEYQEHKQR